VLLQVNGHHVCVRMSSPRVPRPWLVLVCAGKSDGLDGPERRRDEIRELADASPMCALSEENVLWSSKATQRAVDEGKVLRIRVGARMRERECVCVCE